MKTRSIEPDQGWAWMILVASFLSQFTYDGIICSFGIFFVEFLHVFREGRSATSWINSVNIGFLHIVGGLIVKFINSFTVADPGGPRGPGPPWTPNLRPQTIF